MCGFVGYVDLRAGGRVDRETLERMTETLFHRGPDASGFLVEKDWGIGFRRLSIIDLESGDQPIYSEDGSLAVVCNGEIYNYKELRARLVSRGHTFRTASDVEVLIHEYEERGEKLLPRLNGQFAFAIVDRRDGRFLLARDPFGICPLYYALADGFFLFASEIKAILAHPAVERRVDLTGLDQILSFPGLVSPRTMFQGVKSLKAGHFLSRDQNGVRSGEYWDLEYPVEEGATAQKPEEHYVEQLSELLERSVAYRLQADVPVGFYLSGGMDSSLVAAVIRKVSPHVRRHSFSITFDDQEICEARYQKLMSEHVGSAHHEIPFDWSAISLRLPDMIRHCECPVKETFNTCSLALSEAARNTGIKVVLAGEGADELFAGYMGYRFDRFGLRDEEAQNLEAILEEEIREKLWGDRRLFYEKDQYTLREVKTALYSDAVREAFADFDCLNFELVNKERLRGRHFIHQRSYLDFKLRLADHLLGDHGDRMVLANSVEGRYPFLDVQLVDFVKTIPPDLKLNGFCEKYVLKKVAEPLVPRTIVDREKFGFRSPGSPYLLQRRIEWVEDLLSSDRIKREGYFDPGTVERLKARYSSPGFKLNPHLEDDLLMVVLTFNMFREMFALPTLR
ncbi:MAG TPA: asparagine synthase (glutamine-hydrolyzing) [Thermoanaerobaculia bacterium]|nr:asparagine synthase (glutamine-hydrolyzing) [Thermoanaerobaculia bacterium]